MQECKINAVLSLKFENNNAWIYVNGERKENFQYYDPSPSIEVFNAHCSDVKKWYDNDYRTEFFPKDINGPFILLFSLYKAKEEKAVLCFKKELIRHFLEHKGLYKIRDYPNNLEGILSKKDILDLLRAAIDQGMYETIFFLKRVHYFSPNSPDMISKKDLETALDIKYEDIKHYGGIKKNALVVLFQELEQRRNEIKFYSIKHELPTSLILKEIETFTDLRESDIMDLLSEKHYYTSNKWNRRGAIIEIALERGLDLLKPYREQLKPFRIGESELIVGDASIEEIIERVDFNSVLLSEFYKIFGSNDYDDEEKTRLFYTILDKVDISKNFVDLLDLITSFEEPEYFDSLDFRFETLESLYFKALETCPDILLVTFPEVLKVNRELGAPNQIWTFLNVVNAIKNTDIMNKHYSVIEDEFKELLDYFYDLDDYWFGKHDPRKWEFFYALEEIVEGTELLRKDVPNFSKLLKFYPSFEKKDGFHYVKQFITEYVEKGEPFIELHKLKFETFEASFLVSLYSLIKVKKKDDNVYYYDHDVKKFDEHQEMLELQYLSLTKIFEILLDKFDEIQKDEEVFSLFSKFFKALKHKKHALAKLSVMKKMQKFTTNLLVIKEIFPEIWNEYESNSKDPEDIEGKYKKEEGLLNKFKFFTKLIKLILRDEPMYRYMKPGKFEQQLLHVLNKGQPLTESQWSRLLLIFEIMIENFYRIQNDKDHIHLPYSASSFVKSLQQKKPDLVKKIIFNKISLFRANLTAIKKWCPKEWNKSLILPYGFLPKFPCISEAFAELSDEIKYNIFSEMMDAIKNADLIEGLIPYIRAPFLSLLFKITNIGVKGYDEGIPSKDVISLRFNLFAILIKSIKNTRLIRSYYSQIVRQVKYLLESGENLLSSNKLDFIKAIEGTELENEPEIRKWKDKNSLL